MMLWMDWVLGEIVICKLYGNVGYVKVGEASNGLGREREGGKIHEAGEEKWNAL